MSKYKTLIFDLDDTLIDNEQSIKYAFTIILEYLGMEYNDELFKKWKNFDNLYWHNWETGNMIIPNYITTIEEKVTYLRANRFVIFFQNLEINFQKAININELYCNMLGVNIIEIENAKVLLQELYHKYEILIATNGPRKAAINKLEKANLINYISSIICSDDIGYQKPMPEFFDFIYDKSKNKDKNKMLIIRDSLTTDILGGMNNGIDTCWFNPKQSILPEKYLPTITIYNLLQLKKKLK